MGNVPYSKDASWYFSQKSYRHLCWENSHQGNGLIRYDRFPLVAPYLFHKSVHIDLYYSERQYGLTLHVITGHKWDQ